MWQFNSNTNQWEWIESPTSKKALAQQQSQFRSNILSALGQGETEIEQAIKSNLRKETFESLMPGENYDDYFQDREYKPGDFQTNLEPIKLEGEEAEKYELLSEKTLASPYIGSDVMDLLAEDQSTVDKWANGVVKFVGKTATNVAGGLAMFPGLIYGAATGSFKNVYDNAFQRALDEANEAMDEALPNYVTREAEQASLLSQMGTANFWANDVLGGLSFVAGAVLTEYLSAGIATPLALSRAGRLLKTLDKTSDVAEGLAAVQRVKTLSNIDSGLKASRQLVSGTFYEAGVESRHFVEEAKTNFINDFQEEYGRAPSEEELAGAMDKIYNVGNGVFALNSALVGINNMATLPRTFGPALSTKLGFLANPDKIDDVAKGVLKTKDLSKGELYRAAKSMGKTVDEVKALEYIDKTATFTRAEKYARMAYKIGANPFREGIFEEMLQGSVNKGALDYISSYVDEDSRFDLYSAVESLGQGIAETYGSKEGWKEGLIGMIIGGAGFAGPSAKGKGIGWQGGVWDAFSDPLKTKRDTLINQGNRLDTPGRVEAMVRAGVAQKKASAEYDAAVEVGDMLTAKTAENDSFFTMVNLRMRLGDYQQVEDDINGMIDGMSDEAFADMMGYENSTPQEITSRKQYLKTTLLNRAKTIKKNILDSRSALKNENEYVQDALAYAMSSVSNVDAREKELSEIISSKIGTVDSRELVDIMNANNKIKFKKNWLDNYNSKLRRLEGARKRLITLGLNPEKNKGRIADLTEKISNYEAEISQLEQKEFESRKTDAMEAPEYLRDFDAFKDQILKMNDTLEKINKHYQANPLDKKELEVALRDLEKLAQRREQFNNEISRLFTKEGRKKFLDVLEDITVNQKKDVNSEEFTDAISTFVTSVDAEDLLDVKLADVQKKAYENVGLRLRNSSLKSPDTITEEDALAQTEPSNDIKDSVEITPEDFPEVKSEQAKAWVKNFIERTPPAFDPNDPVDIKIAKTKSRLKYVKDKFTELEELVNTTKGTAVEADYKLLFDSRVIQDKIGQLEAVIKSLEDSKLRGTADRSKPVIYNASKFGQIFIDTSFVPQENLDALASLDKDEVANSLFVRVEDYDKQGQTAKAKNRSDVDLIKGIVDMPGKGAMVYLKINGEDVLIGGLLDPRRFIINGVPFNPENNNHLELLNPAFVTVKDGIIEPTNEGKIAKEYYYKMLDLFVELETTGEVSNETLKENFYVVKSGGFDKLTNLPLENRPTIDEELIDPKFEVQYNYETVDSNGKVTTVTEKSNIIIREDKSGIKAYTKTDKGWVIAKGNKLEAITQIYVHTKTSLESNKLTGQFFALIYNPNSKSNYNILSAQFPSESKTLNKEDKDYIVDTIQEKITEQLKIQKEAPDGSKILGLPITDSNNNPYLITIVTDEKDENGNFKLSNSIDVELYVTGRKSGTKGNVGGVLTLNFSIAGNKVLMSLNDIVVKDGLLKKKFGDKGEKTIKDYDDLIKIINARIKHFVENKNADGKYNLLKTKTGSPIQIGDFKVKVDVLDKENVADQLGQLKLNAVPDTSVVIKLKGVKEEDKKEKDKSKGQGFGITEAIAGIDSMFNNPNIVNENTDFDDLRTKILDNLTSDMPNLSQRELAIRYLDNKIAEAKAKVKPQTPPTGPPVTPTTSTTITPTEKSRVDEIIERLKEIKLDRTLSGNLTFAQEEYQALLNEKESILSKYTSTDEIAPFSISQQEATDPIDMQVAEDNLRRMLSIRTPDNPNGTFGIDDVNTIMTNIKNNGYTWGAFFNNIIYLSKKAGKGTEYHEAFHAVFRTLLKPAQINAYYQAARKEFGKPTTEDLANLKNSSSAFVDLTPVELEKLWLEEKMAEAFQKYAIKKQEKPKGLLGILFDKIKKLLGFVKDNKSTLDLLFDDIYSGKYRDVKPVNKIIPFSTPVFHLIQKNPTYNSSAGRTEGGFYNNAQSERIINTIALEAYTQFEKNGEISDKDILDLINIKALEYYDPSNFLEELSKLAKIDRKKAADINNKIQEIQDSLLLTKNQEGIAKEVRKRLSFYNLQTKEEQELDELSEEVAERNFDATTAEIGGFGTLSKAMRQYIAFTKQGVDEFGFGSIINLEEEKFQLASNAFTIYTAVERLLANTNPKDMLPKLKLFANENTTVAAFYNKLVADISQQIGTTAIDMTNIDVLSKSSLFNNFVNSFKKDKVPQIVVIYDPESKLFKAYRSNVKDDANAQFEQWSKNFLNSDRNNPINKKANLDALDNIQKELTSETNPTSEERLSKAVESIKASFNTLGITLSNGYIRHSILQNHANVFLTQANIDSGNTSNDTEFYKGLANEYNLFADVKGLKLEDILGLRVSIEQSNNLFKKETNQEKALDTGAIGRLKAIAASNSVFDESVSSTTFENAEGKSIYTYVQPSYLTSEVNKWRSESRRDYLRRLADTAITDDEGATLIQEMLAVEGTTYPHYLAKNMYQTIKRNPYLLGLEYKKNSNGTDSTEFDYNNDFTDAILDNLYVYIIDGIRTESLKEVEGEEGETTLIRELFKGSDGSSYGSLEARTKALMPLSLFAEVGDNTLNKQVRLEGALFGDNKIDKSKVRRITQFVIGVNEAKQTQNTAQLPVQNFFTNGKMSSLALEYIYLAMAQEYDRISNVKLESEILSQEVYQDPAGNQIYDIENYHYILDDKGNKDYTKGRGHDFFQFKALQKVNPGLYQTILEEASKMPDDPTRLTAEQMEEKMKQLIEQGYTSLFDEYLDHLASPAIGLIIKEVAEDGTITYKNSLIPSYYETATKDILDIDKLGDFFFNDTIASMSFNNLINGDYAMLFKDPTDVVKRNARLIASGPSLGMGTSKVAIVKSILAKDRKDFDPKETEKISKLEKQDTTDAQNLGTLNWYINKYLISTGKYTPKVAELYKKMEKGYRLNFAETTILKHLSAMVNPRKIVGSDRYFYDKTSIKTLLRSETSYIYKKDRKRADDLYDRLFEARAENNLEAVKQIYTEIHKLWKPLPNNIMNHDLLNKLEMDNIDILIYDSAIKTMKANVGTVSENNDGSFNWNLNPIVVNDESFREQVKTDNMKTEITDPTQMLNIAFSEQNSAQKVNILGKETTLGDVVDAYFNIVSERSKIGFEKMRKAIIEGNQPAYKELLKMFKNNLEMTGADPYLIEMVSQAEGSPDMPKFNLNMPSTIDKIESMFLSFMSKNTLKVKAPGHKFTLITDAGSGVMVDKNGSIVTDLEFQRNPSKYEGNVKSRRLAYRKEDAEGNYYTEIKISAQFAEQNGLKPGDVLPPELFTMVGTRIPGQDKHSMGYFKVVDFLPAETGNQIMMPFEIIRLSGADFDVDSEFVRVFDYFKSGKDQYKWFGQYLKTEDAATAIEEARQEYIQENSTNKEIVNQVIETLKSNASYQEKVATIIGIKEEFNKIKEEIKENNQELYEAIQNLEDAIEDVYRDSFGFDANDNYVQMYSFKKKDFQSLNLNKRLIRRIITNNLDNVSALIRDTNAEISTLKSEMGKIKRQEVVKILDAKGYNASEAKFEKKFGATVRDNISAYKQGKFKNITPITMAEANNLLVPMIGSMVYNDSNREIANTPATTDAFNALEDRLKDAEIVDDTVLKGIHDPLSKNMASTSNDTGKRNIGPAAIFNLLFQRLHRAKIKVREEYVNAQQEDYKALLENFLSEFSNGFTNNVDSKGQITNKQGKRVNDLISTVISAMTDNAKDPKAAKFNLTYDFLGTALMRIGMGEGFDTTMLMLKQPVIKELSTALGTRKYQVKTKEEGKFLSLSDVISNIKSSDNYKLENPVDIALTEENLLRALRYSQNPSLEPEFTKDMYKAIQLQILDKIEVSKKISDSLIDLSNILSLSKGLKPTFAENFSIERALKNIGLEIKLRDKGNPENLSDYTITHTIAYNQNPQDYPFDFLDLVKEDKILKTYLQMYTMMMRDSGKFFVLETPDSQELLNKTKSTFKDGHFNYPENLSTLRKHLLSFYAMRAYRKSLEDKYGIKTSDKFTIDNLFSDDLEKLYVDLATSEEFKDNPLILGLTPDNYTFDTNTSKQTGLFGKTLYKLTFNTRTKNNPDYVIRLMDAYRELALADTSSPIGIKARQFATTSFNYLLMKDSGLFRKDTFIRQIAPVYLSGISESMDSVQDLLSGVKGTYEKVFGTSKAALQQEFVELFSTYQPHVFNLLSSEFGYLQGIMKKFFDKEGELTTKEKEEMYPIWRNFQTGSLVVNIYNGIDTSYEANKARKKRKDAGGKFYTEEETKKIFSNINALKATGIIKGADNPFQVGLPPIVVIKDRNPETGGVSSTIYKLEYINKGSFMSLEKNGDPKVDNEFTKTPEQYYETATSDRPEGTIAYYKKIDPIATKEILPYFYKVKEWTDWTGNAKLQLEISKAKESKETKPEVQQGSKMGIDVFAAFRAKVNEPAQNTPTPVISTTETPTPSTGKKSLYELALERVKETNPTKERLEAAEDFYKNQKDLKMINMALQASGARPINPTEIKESKESKKAPVSKDALTILLDKLSNKFGIKWEFSREIPGLGQFKDGKVYINPDKAKQDTPFHEFAHPFIAIVKLQNPLLYKNLVNQINKTKVGRDTLEKVQKLYPELTYDEQLEETIVDLIGQYSADLQAVKEEKGLWNAIKTFLRRISEYIKSLLTDSSKAIVPAEIDPNMTFQELAALMVVDNPVDLGGFVERTPNGKKVSEESKNLFNIFANIADDDVLEIIENCK